MCVFVAAGDSEQMWHDILGAKHSRLAANAEIVGQHSASATADRRTSERRVCHV